MRHFQQLWISPVYIDRTPQTMCPLTSGGEAELRVTSSGGVAR